MLKTRATGRGGGTKQASKTQVMQQHQWENKEPLSCNPRLGIYLHRRVVGARGTRGGGARSHGVARLRLIMCSCSWRITAESASTAVCWELVTIMCRINIPSRFHRISMNCMFLVHAWELTKTGIQASARWNTWDVCNWLVMRPAWIAEEILLEEAGRLVVPVAWVVCWCSRLHRLSA